MIQNEFPGKDTKSILADIEEIFLPAHHHLISSFKLNSEKKVSDIDDAILKGLLKAKNKNYRSTIELCLTWNRVDIAQNYIFTPDIKDKVKIFLI
jgi:hypothetical protein